MNRANREQETGNCACERCDMLSIPLFVAGDILRAVSRVVLWTAYHYAPRSADGRQLVRLAQIAWASDCRVETLAAAAFAFESGIVGDAFERWASARDRDMAYDACLAFRACCASEIFESDVRSARLDRDIAIAEANEHDVIARACREILTIVENRGGRFYALSHRRHGAAF